MGNGKGFCSLHFAAPAVSRCVRDWHGAARIGVARTAKFLQTHEYKHLTRWTRKKSQAMV
jgi:hypothetical protein